MPPLYVGSKIGMTTDQKRSLATGRILPILLYTLSCVGIGYLAFTLIDRHVSSHRVPSAFGLEYLVVLLPFLASLLSFPLWPPIICDVLKFLFRANQLRLTSPLVLATSAGAYGVLLLGTGFFFTWARQQ